MLLGWIVALAPKTRSANFACLIGKQTLNERDRLLYDP